MFFGDSAYQVNQTIHPTELLPESPYIGLEHIEQESLQLIGIGDASKVTSNKRIFRKGDILFGKLRPYFRKVINADFDGICSTDIWVIRPKENIDSNFLYYWCSSWEFINFVNSASEGTRMPRAKWEVAINHEIPNHTYENQKIIGNILGSLDKKIQLNKKTNYTLEEIAKALFKSWFIDFDPVRAKAKGLSTGLPDEISDLFPSSLENSELGEIPSNWKKTSISQLIEINPIRKITKNTIAPFLEMKGVQTYGHTSKGVYDRQFTSGTKFQQGDTLLARITPCLENGKTAMVDFLDEGQIGWGSTEFIVLSGKEKIHNPFVYYLSRSEKFREYAIRNMTGSSGRQRVPPNILYDFNIAKPPTNILNLFSEIAYSFLQKITIGSQENSSLEKIRNTLLPKLISGELSTFDAARKIQDL